MKRALILVAVVAALAVSATSAQARTADCPRCVPLYNVVNQFAAGIVQFVSTPGWWTRPRSTLDRFYTGGGHRYSAGNAEIAPGTPVVEGGVPGIAAAAQASEVAQARFLALYRAFPRSPTAAQWKARWRPLIQQAIVADTSMLTVVATYVAAMTAYNQAALAACAPDKSTCPADISNPMDMFGLVFPQLVAADRAALTRLLSRPFSG